MRKMFKRKLMLSVLVIIAITIFSCQKNSVEQTSTQKNPTVQNLANNSSFVKFVEILDNFESHKAISGNSNLLSKAQLKSYLTSQSLTEKQLTQIAICSGYTSLNEFLNVFNSQDKIVSNLRNEFKDINFVSIDSLSEAITLVRSSFNSINIKLAFDNPDDLCKRIYDNCYKRASATYTAAILACTSAAVGIGAASFGVGGLLFEIACGGTAYYYLGAQRDECSLNYEVCIKKQ